MPLADDEIRIDHMCGRDDTTGHWWGFIDVKADAGALRRLGLHPDQPTSRPVGPSPPAWWHAAAERTWHRPPTS